MNFTDECPKLETINNGHIVIEKGVTGLHARYWCNENYHLSGAYLRACLEKLKPQWSDDEPMCMSKSI